MKRITLVVALVAVGAVSACQPTTGPNSNQPTTNANVASTPTPAPTVSANDIIEKEKQLFETIKQKNWDAFAAMLADDSINVTSVGVHNKTQTLDLVKKIDLKEFTLTDVKVVNVDKDAAVVTYTSNAKGSYDGQPLPAENMRETSAWVYRGGKWITNYHQETQIVPPPPPPASSPASSPAAAASPAAPSASSTPLSADASITDREKQVWEMFQQKNWDGFAALLADDFIEVEPFGVMNKAASVEGVKQTNFDGAALSDFMEVKFDADAGLVTYVVKGPREFGQQGMRHTTVWVNRGGRWQPVFHQGTNIEP